jgi:DNA modification methylase
VLEKVQPWQSDATGRIAASSALKPASATYPDKLAEDLILTFSRPDDLVPDPMCGSGTTCVMAARNRRRYIGIDVAVEYVEIAKKRFETEGSAQKLL